jgi:asparagine synthase (glutamine-hydrolysing)
MCGISGLVTAAQDETPPLDLVRIVNSQSARGPDSVGYSRQLLPDGRAIWLAHNRLSIIDLSAAGNQPFVAENGRYTMVFNGAIYNYIELRRELQACGRFFRSSSDTEVLLEAFAQWGINAFSKFLGMFAVAIYDAASQKLTLARDRFGVKPLYYIADKSVIRFASTATGNQLRVRWPGNQV